MTLELAIVLGLLALAIALFGMGRPRADAVAALVLLVMPFTGIISMAEALEGFSDPSVVLIAALFVVGEGLVRTGIARTMGDWLVARAAGNATRLTALLMLIVGTLGSVMSSTGVVAIFVPVVLRICARMRLPPGQLMMPLSVAALISGMLTLVGTAPNLVVHGALQRAGYEGFSFFSLTPFGLPILLLGILYMLVARRWLGAATADIQPTGRPTVSDLARDYGLEGHAHRLQIGPASPLAGHSLSTLRLRARYGMNVMAIERHGHFDTDLLDPAADTVLIQGDRLLVHLNLPAAELPGLYRQLGLHPLPLVNLDPASRPRSIGMVEVFIPPGSELRGQTVLSAAFRSRRGLTVIGLRRGGEAVSEGFLDRKLQPGDTLLLIGPWKDIRRSQLGRRDVVLLNQPEDLEEAPPADGRAPQALFSLAVMVLLMVTGFVSNLQAALFGCALMVALRCIDLDAAYRSIHWQSIVLIAGMLPFSLALQKTGGVTLAADGLVWLLRDAGPLSLLAAFFAFTAVTGLFISNTATAVLMAPVAIATAKELDLSPYPFAMIVVLAASAAFMTPVSSPVNTLVLGPGRYRFGDFLKVGVPFTILTMVVSVLLVFWLLPLH